MVVMRWKIDPMWWSNGEFEGRPIRDILAQRDVGALLRFVNRRGLSRSAIVAATGMTETAVRECWQGRRRVEKYEVLERIADGLEIPRGYMGLAYGDGSPGPEPAPVISTVTEPADYMSLIAEWATGGVPRAMATGGIGPAGPPDVITTREIDVLHHITDLHRRYDAEFGGGSCRDSAAAYLNWARGMLSRRCSTDVVGRALHAALSDLQQVVGWACHDLGDHARARALLLDSLLLARKAGDLQQAAGALYRLGRVSIHQGRADEALRIWRLGATVAHDSGCGIAVAVLHANQAWAYARLGDDLRAGDALSRATAERRRADGDAIPGWARFFSTPADLMGMTGLVLSALAAHPDHRTRNAGRALEAWQDSLSQRRPEEGRSRVLDMIGVAGAGLLTHDLDVTQRFGLLAVDAAATITSQRAIDRLRDVVDLGESLGLGDLVAELSERIEVVASGAL